MQKNTPTQSRTTEDCIYAAGFFDGEGCISIGKNVPNKDSPWQPLAFKVHYSLRVSIGQKDPHILHWHAVRWGGSVHRNGNKQYEGYRWSVTTLSARTFLADIQPFLIGKKAQADLVLNRLSLSEDDEKELKRLKRELLA